MIAYQNRMSNLYTYLTKQHSISQIQDVLQATEKCDLQFRQQWHSRYASRLTKLLNKYL